MSYDAAAIEVPRRRAFTRGEPSNPMIDVLLILIVVVLIFGTRKLRSIGSDLGTAVKGFRQGLAGTDAGARRARDAAPERPDAEFPEVAAPQRDRQDGT